MSASSKRATPLSELLDEFWVADRLVGEIESQPECEAQEKRIYRATTAWLRAGRAVSKTPARSLRDIAAKSQVMACIVSWRSSSFVAEDDTDAFVFSLTTDLTALLGRMDAVYKEHSATWTQPTVIDAEEHGEAA